ncbi:trypsin-1-like [Hyalella azteca]|uniref:Trypsin-1-like n=1 Tax=Hyalella azteca TaxID=294128 RepID=A0A8B7NK34_HYAAZ|nr:trypsin-1-like [Hyalella azteca]
MKVVILCLMAASAAAAPSSIPRLRKDQVKIINGTDVAPGEIPYQLSFQQLDGEGYFDFCGAIIYSENWMISAGHCVEDIVYSNNLTGFKVVAGEHSLSIYEGTEQNRDIVQVIRHENFDPVTLENDISLIKVASPLVFNDYVQPAKLPEMYQEFVGNAVVSGWGETIVYLQAPDILQKVTVPIVSDEDCKADYAEGGPVLDSMMCAGEAGKDGCYGDSGGPMTCDGYLCGVVSWGHGCAEAGYPGVYTQVSYFVDWIKANAV